MLRRENWTTKAGFILAGIGSAIGLGNIWGFPFLTGTHGGAVFVFMYILAVVFMGYPLLVAELSIGRETQKNPVGAVKALAPNTPWWVLGGLLVLVPIIIMGFYSLIGGWVIAYMAKSIEGFAPGMDFRGIFGGLQANTGILLLVHGAFMAMTMGILFFGVVKGIQRWVTVLLPGLFALMLVLIVRGVTLPGAGAGLHFYLFPNFGRVTWEAPLAAIGQSFFSLSLAMGIMLTYGSYASKKAALTGSAAWIAAMDTGAALLAGFAIFPAVFALGFDPAHGAGLAFVVLPAVFAAMPFGGSFFAFLFFSLLFVAALTSSISLVEVINAWLMDSKGWSRRTAVLISGISLYIVGIPAILGFSLWRHITPLGMGIFPFLTFLIFQVLLPLGGILTAIFVGYVWTARKATAAANEPRGRIYLGNWYGYLLKYVIPIPLGILLAVRLIQFIW